MVVAEIQRGFCKCNCVAVEKRKFSSSCGVRVCQCGVVDFNFLLCNRNSVCPDTNWYQRGLNVSLGSDFPLDPSPVKIKGMS